MLQHPSPPNAALHFTTAVLLPDHEFSDGSYLHVVSRCLDVSVAHTDEKPPRSLKAMTSCVATNIVAELLSLSGNFVYSLNTFSFLLLPASTMLVLLALSLVQFRRHHTHLHKY